jgi:DNA-binding response OmpR family regulator
LPPLSGRSPDVTLLDGLTILYPEDDPNTREGMTLGLERQGARVLATDSAQVALLLFEQHRPDAVDSGR